MLVISRTFANFTSRWTRFVNVNIEAFEDPRVNLGLLIRQLTFHFRSCLRSLFEQYKLNKRPQYLRIVVLGRSSLNAKLPSPTIRS